MAPIDLFLKRGPCNTFLSHFQQTPYSTDLHIYTQLSQNFDFHLFSETYLEFRQERSRAR